MFFCWGVVKFNRKKSISVCFMIIVIVFSLLTTTNFSRITSNSAIAARDDSLSTKSDIISFGFEEIGQWDHHYGQTKGLCFYDQFIYCANSQAGLIILNATDLSNPTYVGEYADQGGLNGKYSWDVDVVGNYAFLADDDNGLQIINVANPVNPTLVGHYNDHQGQSVAVQVQGSYAYIADGYEGLEIIDITTKTNPIEIGQLHSSSIGFSYDVFVLGNYAHLITNEGYAIVSVVNPASPVKVSSKTLPDNSFCDVCVSGDLSFVVIGDYMYIYNISNPVSPVLLKQQPLGINGKAVCINNQLAYVSTEGGVFIYNISAPSNPVLLANYYQICSLCMCECNNILVANDINNNINLLNATDPYSPSFISEFSNGGFVRCVDVEGSYAYLTEEYYGLAIVDISNPTNPIEVGRFDDNAKMIDVQVVSNYAFVGDYIEGLKIFDVSNPSNPIKVGSYYVGGCVDLQIVGNYAFLATLWDNLVIVDISDVSSPTLVKKFEDSSGQENGLCISEGYAYIANRGGPFSIVDVTNPGAPIKVSEISGIDLTVEACIKGNFVFIADEGKGLSIINVTIKNNPQIAFRTDYFYCLAEDVIYYNKLAIVAFYWQGVQFFDVSDVSHPVCLDTFLDRGQCCGLVMNDNLLYIADGADGLEILNLTVEVVTPPTETLTSTNEISLTNSIFSSAIISISVFSVLAILKFKRKAKIV